MLPPQVAPQLSGVMRLPVMVSKGAFGLRVLRHKCRQIGTAAATLMSPGDDILSEVFC